jgi:nucleoside-diphosphate-sugar epimerase
MSGERVVLVGATGMIGGLALRHALADPAVASVTTVGRRAMGLDDPKLLELRHEDFTDFHSAEDALKDQDLALFCLGVYSVTPRAEPNVTYRIMRTLYPAVRRIYPNIGISSEDLARAMLQAGLSGTPGHDSPVLENRDIRRLAAEMA